MLTMPFVMMTSGHRISFVHSVCVCVVRKKRGLGTASVHCPLNGDYMLTYYFNQVVTVSFPLISCNNLYYSQCIYIHICHVSHDHNLTC